MLGPFVWRPSRLRRFPIKHVSMSLTWQMLKKWISAFHKLHQLQRSKTNAVWLITNIPVNQRMLGHEERYSWYLSTAQVIYTSLTAVCGHIRTILGKTRPRININKNGKIRENTWPIPRKLSFQINTGVNLESKQRDHRIEVGACRRRDGWGLADLGYAGWI